MYFGLVTQRGREGEYSELCLFPEKANSYCELVRVSKVAQTDSSVHFLSNEEAFVAAPGPDDVLEISPVPPAKLYLTPNRPERPGFSVNKIKASKNSAGRMEVFFDRDKGWERWNPAKKLY